MIYDIEALKIKYRDYKNINQKIAIEAKKGHLIRIKRGLYTDNLDIDKPVIANLCYGPSYLSFEYALSQYGLIPEYVPMMTSACFGNRNSKRYTIKGVGYAYRRIPDTAFPAGISFMKNEEGVRFKIASKEKALCDQLYSKYPVRSIKDLEIMLFDDLRIDEEEFDKLDFPYIQQLIPLYRSNTLKTFGKYLERRQHEKND